MTKYYLAIDIGASSGRHILGHLENGKMKIEEIYRFENRMIKQDGKLLWDLEHLFDEILNGMKECKKLNKLPCSMSIDTWAVDYVLLDENDQILGDTYGYRDHRTDGMDKKVYEIISETELYQTTGIQKQIFNTIYQLMAVKENSDHLDHAKTFLMLPDYFIYRLTGNKFNEYTNASSTQLVDPHTKEWNRTLIEKLGYPYEMFLPLSMPQTNAGNLKHDIQKIVGFDCQVILCASHDTASAVMAMPCEDNHGLYISSGTWSLMGVELESANLSLISQQTNFTNEGGYDHRFRYLKNIMGLWMIQQVRHELKDAYSFGELCELAMENMDYKTRVDVNDPLFLSPSSMIGAIEEYCFKTKQKAPESVGQIANLIYQSLGECYAKTKNELENNTHQTYDHIYIIGGGANAAYLDQVSANYTRSTVYAGPTEATAIGNIMVQMIKDHKLNDLQDARKCVRDSFKIVKYIPETEVK